MEISFAEISHVEELFLLFDQYRVVYKQPSNPVAAREFLEDRFRNNDSVIFAAIADDQIVGFTQLYPSFSSVAMNCIWILNDLFVKEAYRQRGVAKSLMKAAEEHARTTGAIRIVLATQISNVLAQALYESLGYNKDKEFYHYVLELQ